MINNKEINRKLIDIRIAEEERLRLLKNPLSTALKQDEQTSVLNSKLPIGLTVSGGRLQVQLPPGSVGLTDKELRASDLNVTISNPTANTETGLAKDATFVKDVDGGIKTHVQNFPAQTGLTNGQLRATPIPVVGNMTLNSGNLNFQYNEVLSVVMSVLTIITTYTATLNDYLQNSSFSGINIAEYTIFVNGNAVMKKRTNFTDLNNNFNFIDNGGNGFKLNAGDIVEIKVKHLRTSVSDFNNTLQIFNI